MDQVGHEGDLGDGVPEAPGEEVVDDPAIPSGAGEGDPHEAEAPACLVEGEVRSFLEEVDKLASVMPEVSVCPEDQEQPQQSSINPDEDIELPVDDESLVLGEPEDVARHDPQYVALTTLAPGRKVKARDAVFDLPLSVPVEVGDVPE